MEISRETRLADLPGTPDDILREAIRHGLIDENAVPIDWLPPWQEVWEANGTIGDLAVALDRFTGRRA